VTLLPSTFIAVVKEICVGLGRTGFRTVIVLTGNRANDPSVECACWEAKLELGDTRVLWLAYQSVMKGRLVEAVGHNVRKEDMQYGSSGHGGYVEMSLAALYDPNSVRPDLYVKPDSSGADFKRSLSVGGPMFTDEYTDDGIFGDPHGTSPELGKQIADFCATEIAKEINIYLERFSGRGKAAGV
ncbi:MAG: creatininase family protein, partial [Vulcanimicrobiaceae bacterium]